MVAPLISPHADVTMYLRPCGNATCYNGGSHVCNEYTGTCLCRHPYTGQYCEDVVGELGSPGCYISSCYNICCYNTGMMQLLAVQIPVVTLCIYAAYVSLCSSAEQPCFCLNGGYFDAYSGSCVCSQDYTGAHCEYYNGTGDCLRHT